MTDAALTLSSPAPAGEEIRALQSRIQQMQATKLDTRRVRTHPALESLLPGGSLRSGAAYSVESSTALVMALMAGPSADGVWCGVIGLPDFGVEAASHFGIDLERLALVPHPGEEWLTVTAAMADVVGVVVTRAPGRVTDSAMARLQARIRQRGVTLIVLGDWPQSEASLRIVESSWAGIGQGNGHLAARQVLVSSTARVGSGRPRRARLWLPDRRESFRPVLEQTDVAGSRGETGGPGVATTGLRLLQGVAG
ncbi:hypothetical protein [Herbiconiux ginsengi]|uniref:Protein ImuA n=1 Tax=Herbiconiux ginsengi TaxID=381665 RepID=A0A1H3PUR1_9MICO|nr:hypothetical protein [Herbiconiux ginsengi]SDZ04681.1 hypothetical protein SAMN05216554_2108 [Herbiconiux ginsengi]